MQPAGSNQQQLQHLAQPPTWAHASRKLFTTSEKKGAEREVWEARQQAALVIQAGRQALVIQAGRRGSAPNCLGQLVITWKAD